VASKNIAVGNMSDSGGECENVGGIIVGKVGFIALEHAE
jgi:hypothetical protein